MTERGNYLRAVLHERHLAGNLTEEELQSGLDRVADAEAQSDRDGHELELDFAAYHIARLGR